MLRNRVIPFYFVFFKFSLSLSLSLSQCICLQHVTYSNVEHNLKAVKEEMEAAKKQGKTKLVEKLTTKEQNLVTRKQTIEKITPITRRLVHGDMIQKCWARLFPLQHLEQKDRSIKLTIKDLEALSEKGDIEQQITQMQNASRGWFEEEAVFEQVGLI